jgi:hypothetical protein
VNDLPFTPLTNPANPQELPDESPPSLDASAIAPVIQRLKGRQSIESRKSPGVPLAIPVFITKGLQFPVQPVKIINSELFLAIGLISGYVVPRKELG